MTRAILIDHNASTRPVRRSALNGVVDSAESVSNIQEALNAMRRERFDVVVAAIDPSSDDGRSLLEHSRAPVVMLTQSDARQEAIRRGAFDALVTTDHDVLVRAAVQRALNSRSATGGEARPDMSLQAREPDDMPTLEQIEQYYVDQVLTQGGTVPLVSSYRYWLAQPMGNGVVVLVAP